MASAIPTIAGHTTFITEHTAQEEPNEEIHRAGAGRVLGWEFPHPPHPMELGCVTLVHQNFTNQKPLLSLGVHGFYWGFIEIIWLIDSLTTYLNSTSHPLYLP